MLPAMFSILRLAAGLPLVLGSTMLSLSLPAQTCTSGPPTTLGSVTVQGTTCSKGNRPPNTSCFHVAVACSGIPTLQAELRVSEPEANRRLRGTVVLGTGGGGTEFYFDRPGGKELIQELQQLGFRVVDRRWYDAGWFGSQLSVRKQSCRYATLLTWIHNNVHTKGAFCASGNSGGSAELCYALSTWGRGDILDVAVPTGGPPMARLDYLCLPSQAWTNQCRSLVPAGRNECLKIDCNVGTHLVCVGCGSNATAADLQEDSILHSKATLSYPRTRLHMVLGGRDCSSAFPNALLFYNAVTSEKVLEFAPGTPHWTANTPQGREAILRAILGGIACRPGSFNVPALPTVSGTLVLDVHGPASRGFLVYVAVGTGRLELLGLGWVFLATPLYQVGGGTLDNAGRGRFSLKVPNNPSLAGLEFFHQLITGTCVTNLVHVKILP